MVDTVPDGPQNFLTRLRDSHNDRGVRFGTVWPRAMGPVLVHRLGRGKKREDRPNLPANSRTATSVTDQNQYSNLFYTGRGNPDDPCALGQEIPIAKAPAG